MYHALQDPSDDAGPEELAEMEKEVTQLRDDIAATKAREKGVKADLAALNATVSTTDLRQSMTALESEKQGLLARLSILRSGDVKPVSAEKKAGVEKEWKTWQKHVMVRKRICKDMWERCTEILPPDTTKEELWVCFIYLRMLRMG